MNFFKDMMEHPLIQGLGILSLILGFGLDSVDKTEYFFWAATAIGIVLIGISIDVYLKRKLYNTDTLPIPIVINVDSELKVKHVLKNLFKEIEKNTQFKHLRRNLKHYKNIVEDDLVFTYTGDLKDKEKMISFIQIIKYQIRKIKESTPNKVEFHVAYYKKPAFGIFLGSIFSEEDIVVYQKNQDQDVFDKVAEFSKRNYTKDVKYFRKFEKKILEQDDSSNTLLVGVKATSRDINFNADSLKDFKNIIYLRAKHDGYIDPHDEDWVLYAREILTLLNEAQTQYKHITLVHAMPEALAVILGMGIGHYWPLMITQYVGSNYIDIMRTDEVKCYF